MNGNHVEQPNVKSGAVVSKRFCCRLPVNNFVLMLTCLLQEWETESVVLERVSVMSVIEQA